MFKTRGTLEDFVCYVNVLTGMSTNPQLIQELNDLCQAKYHCPLPMNRSSNLFFVKSAAQIMGLRLLGYNPKRSLDVKNITAIVPRVAFTFTQSKDFAMLLQFAVAFFQNNDYDSSLEMLTNALAISEDTFPVIDRQLSACYLYSAFALQKKGDNQSAYNFLTRSIIILERLDDQLHLDNIYQLSILAVIAKDLDMHQLSLAILYRIFNLLLKLVPNHPWVIGVAVEIIENVASTDLNHLRLFVKQIMKSLEGVDPQTLANIPRAASVACIAKNDVKQGLFFAEMAVEVFPDDETRSGIELIRSQLSDSK